MKGVFFDMVEHTGKNAEVIKRKAKNCDRRKWIDYKYSYLSKTIFIQLQVLTTEK